MTTLFLAIYTTLGWHFVAIPQASYAACEVSRAVIISNTPAGYVKGECK